MLKDWPAQEKPREKLLAQGANSLSDAELLAIFLRTGVKGCHVVDLARQLLASFGSISEIFKAEHDDFCANNGLGTAKYVQLQACLEMSKRFLHEQVKTNPALTSSSATKAYLVSELSLERREIFAVLFLDSQHQIICLEKLFMGTINAAAVYPRIVVEFALKHNAAAVIFTHNHPSGVAEASLADRQITQQLSQALALIDVKVLDHIIVAGKQTFSLAEHGQLD